VQPGGCACCRDVRPAAKSAEQKPGDGLYFRLVTQRGDDPFWASQ